MSDSPSAPEGLPPRRFEVALSYPGERRELVQRVAEKLARVVGRDGVLYDRFLAGEFARLNLDAYLPELYLEASGLIVVFLCPEYVTKPWCQLEWQQIKKLGTEESRRIMLLRIAPLSALELSQLGMGPGDSWTEVDGSDPSDVADLIRERLRPPPPPTAPWTAVPHHYRLKKLFEQLEDEYRKWLEKIPGKAYPLELEVARGARWNAPTDEPGERTPRERRLFAVFQEDECLVVLGGPGSGKSVELMLLAHDLDETVRQPPVPEHVPVYLPLSSWQSSDQDLSSWLKRQLNGWPRRCAPGDVEGWIKSDALLPLLDGLDEVSPDDRPACVEAIDSYLSQHGGGLVLSSRPAAYEELAERLSHIRAKVILRPLSESRIESRLAGEGAELDTLGAALHANPELHELARSPLMLRLLIEAFRDAPAAELGRVLERATAERVVEVYVEKMEQRPGSERYGRERTRRILRWFARQLSEHKMDRFEIEQLQPSWLAPSWRWLYAILSRGLSGALVAAIFLLSFMSPLRDYWYLPLWGLVAGVVTGAIDLLPPWRAPTTGKAWSRILRSGAGVAGLGLVSAIVFRLLWAAAARPPDSLLGFYVLALVNGFVFGLRPGDLRDDTRLFETFRWGWSSKRGIQLALCGALFGVFVWWLVRRDAIIERARFALLFIELLTIPFGFLVGGIIGGLHGSTPEIRKRPNQGLWDSFKNSAKAFGCVVAFFVPVGSAFTTWAMRSWMPGAVAGLGVGLLAALWFGGIDILQHLLLRTLLSATGPFPWRWFGFLDHGVNCGLLEKADGRYKFPHGMVRDYFRSLPG